MKSVIVIVGTGSIRAANEAAGDRFGELAPAIGD